MSSSMKIGKNVALAVLSQFPVVSAFSKFCEDYVQDGWQERIDLWKEEVTKRLAQLDAEMEQKIRETSNFASILASAQRGALEDMEEDKVALYANAVINAIKNEDIDNTKKHIFLNMLRDFTKLHIEILGALCQCQKDNNNYVTTQGRDAYVLKYLRDAYPDLTADTIILKTVLQDLENKYLCYISSTPYAEMNELVDRKLVSTIVPEFLAFIAEQENAND